MEHLFMTIDEAYDSGGITESQDVSVNRKHYEWQILNGSRWQRVDNDDVIEAHFCQPGAKGMSINSSLGNVYIDFDLIGTQAGGSCARRLCALPVGTEDMAWYFRDDRLWCEYGATGGGAAVASISSRDVERQYQLNPQGTFTFTVGATAYKLLFSAMTQTNCSTGMVRKVRRRPQFSPTPPAGRSPHLASEVPMATGNTVPPTVPVWEFMGEEGVWSEYDAEVCGYDSSTIEQCYQQNPQSQLQFAVNRYTYTLDFSAMCQVNNQIGTRRAVRRANSSAQLGSACPRWQFLDINGKWKEYNKRNRGCSVSSQDIETQYLLNPTGSMRFATRRFTYELDFSAMTQQNLSTTTSRRVRRLNQ